MFTVLLGEISSYKAVVIAGFLKRTYSGVKIISYDYILSCKNLHTKYSDEHIFVRRPDVNTYIKQLAELVADRKVDLFLPVHSDYIEAILQSKAQFGAALEYMGSHSQYMNLHDKSRLHALATSLGIVVPKQYSDASLAPFPYVAKPVGRSSSKGVYYISNAADLKKRIAGGLKSYIFQEYIHGVGCGYSVYARSGRILSGYGHMRLAEYPITGGSSVYRQSFFVEEMRTVAEKILEQTSWTGFAMFEFKYTTNGKLVLIEVNPRIWGSINQGLQNGVDYFSSLMGAENRPNLPKRRINTYLGPQVYIALLKYALRGNFSPFFVFIKNLPANRADVSVWTDPLGWVSMILRFINK